MHAYSCGILFKNIKNCRSYWAKCKGEVFFTHPLVFEKTLLLEIHNILIQAAFTERARAKCLQGGLPNISRVGRLPAFMGVLG